MLMACRAESAVPASGAPSREGVEALTWRELDVLLLMEGRFTNREIARLLGIPEETVKRHATNLSSKLQVTSRGDAVLRAYDLGFLRADDRETPPSD